MTLSAEYLDQFGDPGLSRIIDLLRLAREEFNLSMSTAPTKADSGGASCALFPAPGVVDAQSEETQ